MILFSFLFISSAFVGGSLLLSGCDSSSNYSENNPADETPDDNQQDENLVIKTETVRVHISVIPMTMGYFSISYYNYGTLMTQDDIGAGISAPMDIGTTTTITMTRDREDAREFLGWYNASTDARLTTSRTYSWTVNT